MHATLKTRVALALGTLVTGIAVAGCRTPQQAPSILITTQPPGARVTLEDSNGNYFTPCQLPPTSEATLIEIAMTGYHTFSGPLGDLDQVAQRSYHLVLEPSN